jgi:uncharacterized membrane protein YfcA
VGGGGLIQLPALLLVLPNAALASCFGTNKLSSIFGTGLAMYRYSQAVSIRWSTTLRAASVALICSFFGARALHLLDPALVKPLVLFLLVAVFAYTLFKRDFGEIHRPKLSQDREQWIAYLIGATLGFYDGFFGPGTGSFLIVAFIGLMGFDFLNASASAKVVNFATNVAAVIYFAANGQILYAYAFPMALCNIIGAQLGARAAITRGSAFVRGLFLLVVSALIAKLTWELM